MPFCGDCGGKMDLGVMFCGGCGAKADVPSMTSNTGGPGQTNLADSNISNYGSKDHKDLKQNAAATEAEFKGAGKKVGLEIWRVENFGLKRWEKKMYGTFFTGDSFIILNTYKKPDSPALFYNVHFWLGAHTTQDEAGTAAYKTVELDDLLGDLPVQFREVQGHESSEFLELFGGDITLLDGGVDSAFNHVKPETYEPRLLHFKGKGTVRITQVPCERASLNKGDVFVLDMGLEVIQWNGSECSAWERSHATKSVQGIRADRNGKPSYRVIEEGDDDEVFWSTLGGKGPIAAATPDMVAKKFSPKLLRVSDATGTLTVKEEASGSAMRYEMLDSDDVFIVDHGHCVYVWIGSGATRQERSQGMKYALDYLKQSDRPLHTPVQRVVEGGETSSFKGCFSVAARKIAPSAKSTDAKDHPVGEAKLGTGCYLTYSPASQGSLFLNWKDGPVPGALAYFNPGKRVPRFKFTQKGGVDELTRLCDSKKKNWYEGWTNFLRMARTHNGQFTLIADDKVTINLYAKRVTTIKPGNWYKMLDYSACVVTGPKDNPFASVITIDKGTFVTTGTRKGAGRHF